MSYHDHRSSRGDPREPGDGNPHDRLFYVYLLGAAAFVLMIWVAVSFERNQPKPPAPKPLAPVIVKIPERVEPPAPPPPPSNQAEKINTPDTAPALTTEDGSTLELRPSVDTPAEATPAPAQEDANAEAIPAEPPAAEQRQPELQPTVHRAGRNHHRRHHHRGQRRVFHHWPGHRHGKPSQTHCEPLCEFFKWTARAAGLIP